MLSLVRPWGSWRIARAVAKDRAMLTVDPKSGHARKSPGSYRDGFKGHIAAEPETGLITANILTGADTSDGEVAVELLADEPTLVEVVGDSGYGGGQTRHDLAEAGHVGVIKPLLCECQLRLSFPLPLALAVPGGFDRDDVRIGYEAAC
jgi:hypothetical protein